MRQAMEGIEYFLSLLYQDQRPREGSREVPQQAGPHHLCGSQLEGGGLIVACSVTWHRFWCSAMAAKSTMSEEAGTAQIAGRAAGPAGNDGGEVSGLPPCQAVAVRATAGRRRAGQRVRYHGSEVLERVYVSGL